MLNICFLLKFMNNVWVLIMVEMEELIRLLRKYVSTISTL